MSDYWYVIVVCVCGGGGVVGSGGVRVEGSLVVGKIGSVGEVGNC